MIHMTHGPWVIIFQHTKDKSFESISRDNFWKILFPTNRWEIATLLLRCIERRSTKYPENVPDLFGWLQVPQKQDRVNRWFHISEDCFPGHIKSLLRNEVICAGTWFWWWRQEPYTYCRNALQRIDDVPRNAEARLVRYTPRCTCTSALSSFPCLPSIPAVTCAKCVFVQFDYNPILTQM